MGRSIAVSLALLASLVACTPSEAPAPSAPEAPPRALPRGVEIPRVRPPLRLAELERCFDDRVVTGPIYTALSEVGYTAAQVEEIRELDFETPADVRLLGPHEFDTAFRRGPDRDRDEDFVTRRIAWALGMVPHGLDADYFLRGEGSGLIAGFYDPRDGLVAIRSEGQFDDELIVLAHELTHAATDQVFGLDENPRSRLIDDRALARDAVSEGDASLVELKVTSRVVPIEATRKLARSHLSYEGEYKPQRRAGVPHLVIDTFAWPYRWGLSFACKVFIERGWGAIDELYRDPPEGTAEIMFPGRHLAGEEPETTAPLGRLEAPWEPIAQAQLGAAHLNALFEAPGDVGKRRLNNPLGRASAWAGGRYRLWVDHDDDRQAFGLALVERRGARGVLCVSMHRWYRKAFFDAVAEVLARYTVAYADENQTAVISCSGRDVLMGVGPDVETARAVAAI